MNTADAIIDDTLGLWWNQVPQFQDERLGCLGAPTDESQIAKAEERLRKEGCTLAIGPMHGNTWRTHRAVIASDGRPPFLLEPVTVPKVAEWFQESGYDILASYSSSLVDLSVPTNFNRLSQRMEKVRVTIRTLRLDVLEEELRKIYRLSLKTFTENFLYTPISEDEFLGMYQKIASMLTPESAFLAEFEGELIGFVFGFCEDDTIIVKTLAVLPERRFAGLGTLLVHRIQEASGLPQAIHALQREDNQSLRISERFEAKVFRRYALFLKQL